MYIQHTFLLSTDHRLPLYCLVASLVFHMSELKAEEKYFDVTAFIMIQNIWCALFNDNVEIV